MNERIIQAISNLKKAQNELEIKLKAMKQNIDEKGSLNMQKALFTVADDLARYTIKDGNWYYNGKDTGIQAEAHDGKDGEQGPRGIPGKDGRPGRDGKPGKDGRPGRDGKSGKDGKDGKPGKDGRPGRDGKDGITPELKIGKIEVSPEYGGAMAKLRPGKDNIMYLDLTLPRGPQGFAGFDGKDAKINGENTIEIKAGRNITINQDKKTLTINSTGGGSGGTSDYEELANLPQINGVELTGNKSLNDLGIQPEGDYALESDIPDVSNFITKTVNDLTYYYKKSETFTKQEVNNLISAITTMDIQVVQTLPVQDISTTTIYLVPKTTAETNDAYDEFIYVSNNWEHIGSTDIDLSGYQTKIDSTHKLPSDLVDDTNQSNLFVTSSEKTTWNNKVDQSDLTNYVEKTDYATTSKAGLVRTSNDYAIQVSGTSGLVFSQTKTFSQYNNASNIMFISKGTLENVIDGYGFITNQDIVDKQDKLIAGANISIASDGKTISANVEEYNNLLYKTLDLTNADKIFTGYIYNGAYSGNQNWRSYEFKAQNIDKIISLSAYTDSSAYKNINFYSKYCSHSSELSSYFISSVPLNEGANKINTYSNIIVPDNCEAIVISHKIQSNMETPIVSLREKKYDKEIEAINSDIKEISNSASNVKAIYKNIWNANDFIFIKDELWLAKPNSTYTGYDQEIRRYKMIDDEWVEQSKLYTDFGHWNTVDYCPENDCLIFGNGANAETTTGNYFTVIKNPLALSGSVLTQNVGIKYNVDIGFKVQAVWGNDNMGEHNIVYLTSNYTRRIVKLLLGKDANGNFDGTFITLSDTTLPTTIGTGGGDFWGDCIYIGDGANYAIWKLSVTDYTVQKIDRTAYLSSGTAISGSTQGVYIDKDYMWVFYNIGTSSNNYLVQYYRGGLTNKSVTTDAHINDLIDAKLGVIENGSY